MRLRQYEGKKVRIISKQSNRVFEGVVGDYIFPEDNVPIEIEAIVIDNPKYSNPIQFNADEIKSIEIIE